MVRKTGLMMFLAALSLFAPGQDTLRGTNYGQDTLRGTIYGQITQTGSGLPVGGAAVFVRHTAKDFGATTDASGYFSLTGLPLGHYDLLVFHTAHYAETRYSVPVYGGNATETRISLEKYRRIFSTAPEPGYLAGRTPLYRDMPEGQRISHHTLIQDFPSGDLNVPGLAPHSLQLSGARQPTAASLGQALFPTRETLNGIPVPPAGSPFLPGATLWRTLSAQAIASIDHFGAHFAGQTGQHLGPVMAYQLKTGNPYETDGSVRITSQTAAGYLEGPIGKSQQLTYGLHGLYSVPGLMPAQLPFETPPEAQALMQASLATEWHPNAQQNLQSFGYFIATGTEADSAMHIYPGHKGNYRLTASQQTFVAGLTHTYRLTTQMEATPPYPSQQGKKNHANRNANWTIRTTAGLVRSAYNATDSSSQTRELDYNLLTGILAHSHNVRISKTDRITTGASGTLQLPKTTYSPPAYKQDSLSLEIGVFIDWEHQFNNKLTFHGGFRADTYWPYGHFAVSPLAWFALRTRPGQFFRMGFRNMAAHPTRALSGLPIAHPTLGQVYRQTGLEYMRNGRFSISYQWHKTQARSHSLGGWHSYLHQLPQTPGGRLALYNSFGGMLPVWDDSLQSTGSAHVYGISYRAVRNWKANKRGFLHLQGGYTPGPAEATGVLAALHAGLRRRWRTGEKSWLQWGTVLFAQLPQQPNFQNYTDYWLWDSSVGWQLHGKTLSHYFSLEATNLLDNQAPFFPANPRPYTATKPIGRMAEISYRLEF